MFRSIMRRLSADIDNEQSWQQYVHACSLIAAYLARNVEDESIFSMYIFAMLWPLCHGFAISPTTKVTTALLN